MAEMHNRGAGIDTPKTLGNGYLFGAPVGDLGWFASLLMGLTAGFGAFFLATFAGIVGLLFWNGTGHQADYSLSYLRVGLPVGILVGVVSLGYLGMLWARRVTKGSGQR